MGVSKGLQNLTALHQGVLIQNLICLSVCNNTKLLASPSAEALQSTLPTRERGKANGCDGTKTIVRSDPTHHMNLSRMFV